MLCLANGRLRKRYNLALMLEDLPTQLTALRSAPTAFPAAQGVIALQLVDIDTMIGADVRRVALGSR